MSSLLIKITWQWKQSPLSAESRNACFQNTNNLLRSSSYTCRHIPLNVYICIPVCINVSLIQSNTTISTNVLFICIGSRQSERYSVTFSSTYITITVLLCLVTCVTSKRRQLSLYTLWGDTWILNCLVTTTYLHVVCACCTSLCVHMSVTMHKKEKENSGLTECRSRYDEISGGFQPHLHPPLSFPHSALAICDHNEPRVLSQLMFPDNS